MPADAQDNHGAAVAEPAPGAAQPPDWLAEQLSSASRNARAALLLFVSAIAYSALTVVSTSDRHIILNKKAALPLIDLEVSLTGFFVLAPVILISLFALFHIRLHRLQRVTDHLRQRYPATPGVRTDSWILNHQEVRSLGLIGKLEVLMLDLTFWWLLPAALMLFSFWIISSHRPFITYLLCVYPIVGVALVYMFWRRYDESPSAAPSGGPVGRGILVTFVVLVQIWSVAYVIPNALTGWEARDGTGSGLVALIPAWTTTDSAYQTLVSRPSQGSERSHWVGLRGARLQGARLDFSTLERADLREADLRGAVLDGADLSGADLRGANLTRASLRKANLAGARLDGAVLVESVLREAEMSDASLRGADLTGAVLNFSSLRRADATGATLSGASFYYGTLKNAILRETVLCDSDLGNTDLSEANLDLANMKGAQLGGAVLRGSSLRKAYIGAGVGVTLDQLKQAASIYGLSAEADSPIHQLLRGELQSERGNDVGARWVQLAQEKLAEEGFYYGDVDRIFGPISRRALRLYQRQRRLEETGVLDGATRNAMNLPDRPPSLPLPGMPRSVQRGLSKAGMSIEEVKGLLRDLGYYLGVVDGTYDEEFTNAVRRFQAVVGAAPDGLLGPRTAGMIMQVRQGAAAVHLETLEAKRILSKHGLYRADMDTRYDRVFEEALVSFQLAGCLVPDGLLGAPTVAALLAIQ